MMARVTAANVYFGKLVYIVRYNTVTGESKIIMGLVYNIRKDAADLVAPNDPQRHWFKFGEAFDDEAEAEQALERYLEKIGETHRLAKNMNVGDLIYVRTPEFHDPWNGDRFSKTYGIVTYVGRTRFQWKTRDGREMVVLRGNGTRKVSDTWQHSYDRIIRHIPIVNRTDEA